MAAVNDAHRSASPGWRILYLEDEPLPRWTGTKMLSALSPHVLTADSCAQAEDLWSQNPIDLIIADYRLGDGLSVDLVERMRARQRTEPVICLSGEADDLSSQPRAQSLFAAIVKKPLEAASLRSLVESLLASPTPSVDPVPAPAPIPTDEPSFPHPVWLDANRWIACVRNEKASYISTAFAGNDTLYILWFDSIGLDQRECHKAEQIHAVFKSLCTHTDAPISLEATLLHCLTLIRRVIDPDYPWSLCLARVQKSAVSFVSNRQGHWNVFWLSDQGEWRRVQSGIPVTNAPFTGLLSLDDLAFNEAQAGIIAPSPATWPQAVWDRVQADSGFRLKKGNAFLLRPSLVPVAFAPLAFGPFHAPLNRQSLLRGIEETLVEHGLAGWMARKTCCALLDLAEWQHQQTITLSWTPTTLTIAAPPETGTLDIPPPFPLPYRIMEPEKAAHLHDTAVQPRFPQPWPWKTGDRIGQFFLVRLPDLVTPSVLCGIQAAYPDQAWLALDGHSTRYFSLTAMETVKSMAQERRSWSGGTAGRVCLTGFSPMLAKIFQSMVLDRDVDVMFDPEALDSLSRRLTSTSERAALLDGFRRG